MSLDAINMSLMAMPIIGVVLANIIMIVLFGLDTWISVLIYEIVLGLLTIGIIFGGAMILTGIGG